MIAQQNEEIANIHKKMSYHNSFERYIDSFLPSFFIDDVEKFDLYSNKNAKHLFYRFNDYIRAYGNKRNKNQTYPRDKKFCWYAENRGKRQAIFGRKNNSCS